MAPYFETAKSFADVPITDEGVETAAFLLASTDFVNMFDLLGGGVFAFVQNDLRSNIAGLRHRFEATAAQSTTLESLVVYESTRRGDRPGTACLVRLVRGLWFTCEALRNLQRDKAAEPSPCFRRSFDIVLRPHLSFIVRSVASVAMMAVPNRHDFFTRLTQGGSLEQFEAELARWLAGLDTIIVRMKAFLSAGGYGTV